MVLNIIWYILFILFFSAYLILDGFDLGVGILHLFVAKDDQERRIMLNSIGPIWDGNEVWLVIGGGVLFAAFPFVYASLFSGFYIAMMLVLLFLILRAVAIEFRSKREGKGWRSLWDFTFSLSSLLVPLLLGVAFGNILSGVPLDGRGNIAISLFDLLTPFALLVGVTTVFMVAMHGALYLTIKTEGDLLARVKHAIPRLTLIFVILLILVLLAVIIFQPGLLANYFTRLWPVVFPLLALVSLGMVWRGVRSQQYMRAFLASCAMIALLLLSAAAGLYPNLLHSSLDAANNLTIFNAASAPNTLTVMLIIGLIGLPIVIAYTAGVYYIFRGKTEIGPESY